MLATETKTPTLHPPAPTSLAESGLSFDLVTQLVLKTLHFAGELRGLELARRLGVNFRVIEPSLESLTSQHQIEIVAGGMVGRPSYLYRITDAGRNRAALFLETSHYVGIAPVPLEQYCQYMAAFNRTVPSSVSRERVRQAFSHLVLGDKVLDQLGPAINARHSLFVYGPPGNGKTVVSQAIRNLLDGTIAIPHALAVEGHIIRFFDPVNHEEVQLDDDAESLASESRHDRRWARCLRPMVMVGGELRLEALSLNYNPVGGFYTAPVQAMANGGVLVIDDFGRQQCSPRDLLNRWIVPLESRVDFLTLHTGQKFEIPFMTLVVFATNIKPVELVDEAFLRRIQYKVFAESPSVEQFINIFEQCCKSRNIAFDLKAVQHLLQNYYRPRRIQLRACQPRDLIDQALSLAEYLSQPRAVTTTLLDAACRTYFVDDEELPATYA